MRTKSLVVLFAAGWVCASGVGHAAQAQTVSYNRDIRPILSDNCFACHGPDQEKRKGDLRLDVRDSVIKPAKSGEVAIVPSKPAQSELIKRITASDPDEQMPPPKSKKTLSPQQIDLLKRWIIEGASYQSHWAFVPPVHPTPPKVNDRAWLRNAIDRFVLARLEAENLRPSPEADKLTLLRRLHLDLIGLPPTIGEADAFLNDNAPDAYEKLVERLLASPHYGERWGRHWLDAARYADSDGFEKDKSRQIFFYRDYVINAFNRDLPYNQFLIEQLAGDLLPNSTQDQIVATGFLRNSMINEEGGVDPEQFRMDAMFDRMDAIGKGMLGLTIQCAQCHSHKYDPITQEEYYRLFAFLNNDHEAQRTVYTPDQQMKIADITRQIKEIEGELRHKSPDWPEQLARWETQVESNQPEWEILQIEHQGENAQRYYDLKDGSVLAAGYAPTKFTSTFKATTSKTDLSGFRLELLMDPNLPAGGPGRSYMGICALSEFMIDVAPASEPAKRTRVKLIRASADYDQPKRPLEAQFDDRSGKHDQRFTGPAAFAIDGSNMTAWGIDAGPGRRNLNRKAVFIPEKPVAGFAGGTVIYFMLQQDHGGWNSDDHQNMNLGRFRLSITNAKGEINADTVPKRVREFLAIGKDKRTDAQWAAIFSYWRTTVPQWKAANERIESLMQQWPEGTTSLTLASRNEPRDTRVLNRGDWLKPTKPVSAGVPAFLHSLPKDADTSRLTFARWIADERSPTTARVFINRVWQNCFGIGLVSTPEDFGLQSEAPSHPELLDWLATEFMEGGWSIKRMHRLIVTSATYRQSSRVSPEMLARDPYNRLLARGARFRVEGEIVRDIALASSGLLYHKTLGRAVMPPAPAFLFQPPASYAPFPWKDEIDAEKYRRGIYVFRRRSTPFPVLQTFDVPNGDFSCVRRQRSNSPLQALVTLNEPTFMEAARALARRAIEEGGASDEQRIAYMFRRSLTRPPTRAEMAELSRLYQQTKQRLADGWLSASLLATGKPEPIRDLPNNTTPTQLAAYTAVARVILNLDETITRE